jgi:glycosyltransferase involved in cell wall biosynthesis
MIDDLNISEYISFTARNLIRSGLTEGQATTVKDAIRMMDPVPADDLELAERLTLRGYELAERQLPELAKNLDLYTALLTHYNTLPAIKVLVVSTASILTPPDKYGGMELMVDYLSRGLHHLGNMVRVIAKTGSRNPFVTWAAKDEKEFPGLVADHIDGFDVVIDLSHDKNIGRAFPEMPQINTYQVMTVGHRVNPVFISSGQRGHIGLMGPIIHYGLRLEDYPPYVGNRRDYLLYMGSVIPEKRIEWAVDIAKRLAMPIKIAGPSWTPDYFDEVVEPLTHLPGVEYVGDVGGQDKMDLLGKATALVHPVGGDNWVEAGAIVIQEALARGTPVLATNNGCIPEYITHGENGVLGDTPEDIANAALDVGLDTLSNWAICRKSIAPFNWFKMSVDYYNLARDVINNQRWTGG